METVEFSNKAKQLIDDIKGICNNAGLGGDANEYKIVTQSFLYKFLNDKFLYEINKLDPGLKNYKDLKDLSQSDYKLLMVKLGTKTAHLKPEHLMDYLFEHQFDEDFAKLFDDTFNDIALDNSEVFSVHTAGNTEILLFDKNLIQNSIRDNSKLNDVARGIINELADNKFNFESIFTAGFDFFSTLFEYMIKDYNKDGGGVYAEYYTPHSVAKIMADILVGDDKPSDATAYDPAAGSGTLLMNLAHRIGEDRCNIYSQDRSQKSSNLLRLNLILNGLSHSIDHVVEGNTITDPRHIGKKFDYIVSNPPFKLDFSKDHEKILNLPNINERFFAGVAKIPKKAKDKMAIYPLFIQHIMFSLSAKGKAAIVVPTGFIAAQGGIEKKIRERLVEQKMLRGVVSMPRNIFATTGTNVSILFLDKANTKGDIVLMDASKLGTTVKEGKNQKTLLSEDEEKSIINTFNKHEAVEDFTVVVSYEQIKEKNYSFSAGQYFEVKIEYTDITPAEFENKMNGFKSNLDSLFAESKSLEKEIQKQLNGLKYE